MSVPCCSIEGCNDDAGHILRPVRARLNYDYDKFGDLEHETIGEDSYYCAKHVPNHVVRHTDWATPVRLPTILLVIDIENVKKGKK